ncbi:MAG: hypothetical protein ACTTIZ_04580 [Treponema sp.]
MKGFSCNKVFFLVVVIVSMLCMACVNDRDYVPTAQIELGIDSNEMGMVGSDLESNMLSVSDFTSKITGSIEELKNDFLVQEKSISETNAAIIQIIENLRLSSESVEKQVVAVEDAFSSFDKMKSSIEVVDGNVKETQSAIENLCIATNDGRQTVNNC